MELYIEFYCLNNFFLNFLINYFCLKICNYKVAKFRIIITTVLEVIISILMLFFDLDKLYIKLILLFIIPLFLSKVSTLKNYIKLLFTLASITCILGGSIYAVLITKNVDLYEISFSSKLLVIYVFFIAFFIFIKIILMKIKQIKRHLIFIENLELIANGKHLKVVGYYDSGNIMYKDFEPVCIISKKVYFWLYKNNSINKIDYVSPITVNSKENLKLISLEEMVFAKEKKSIKNVLCAVSDNLKDYDVLIHADMR